MRSWPGNAKDEGRTLEQEGLERDVGLGKKSTLGPPDSTDRPSRRRAQPQSVSRTRGLPGLGAVYRGGRNEAGCNARERRKHLRQGRIERGRKTPSRGFGCRAVDDACRSAHHRRSTSALSVLPAKCLSAKPSSCRWICIATTRLKHLAWNMLPHCALLELVARSVNEGRGRRTWSQNAGWPQSRHAPGISP